MVWIFLRGLTREATHWSGFPEDFGRALPSEQVILLDLPGNGQLHLVRSPLSISAMVDFCRSELARREVKPPYFLLAMSLGAMVATEWSYQSPEEVAGCVLINTSFQGLSPFYRRLRPLSYLPLLRLVFGSSAPAATEQGILGLTSNEFIQREGVIAAWSQARRERPVKAVNALRQVLAALRYRARTVPPANALLILCSEHDRLVNFECSMTIASRWKCSLALHPSAGHDIPIDDPDWVIERVQHWLAERAKRARATSQN